MARAAPIKPRTTRFIDPEVEQPSSRDIVTISSEPVISGLVMVDPSLMPVESKTSKNAPATSLPVKGPGSRGGKTKQASAREGKRQIAFWTDDATWEVVFLLAARRRSTVQRVMEEAVNLLLASNADRKEEHI